MYVDWCTLEGRHDIQADKSNSICPQKHKMLTYMPSFVNQIRIGLVL